MEDVPNISKYIGKIAVTRVFSKSVFDQYCESEGYGDKKKNEFREKGRAQ